MERPRDLGFAMPPEWWPHARCWMAWPCREAIWEGNLEAARRVVAQVAAAIAEFEPVTMIVRPDLAADASLYLGKGVSVLPMTHDDSWVRDTGPTFLLDGERRLGGVAWRFNGWGELYQDYAQDAQLARRILEHVKARSFESQLVFEGGNLSVDGEGTALVCEPAALDPARNPGFGREEVEAELAACLGVERVIWLPRGMVDDETRGHVDNLACFVRPGVVLAVRDEPGGPHHEALEANFEVLKQATDARGRALEILELPMPKPRERREGVLLTTSYVNFYIANGGIVMPAFDDAADKTAYRVIAAAFPEHEVVQVDVLDLVAGGGGIHCITQQQPKS